MQKLLALLGAKNKEEFMALLMQFIKFGLVGVSNTAVSMAVYYIFLWISPDLYMLGSILGTILSIANAFFWNDKFVFAGCKRLAQQAQASGKNLCELRRNVDFVQCSALD